MDEVLHQVLSTPESQEFKNITDQMTDTFIRKNHDYGNSFFDSLNEEEDLGPARYAIGNKWRRFKQLSMSGDALVDESIEDTLLDMANYCVMSLIWYRANKKNDEL